MKINFEQRPTCSCGVKMKLVEYKGYYDSFNYWRCDNCKLDNRMQNAETDKKEKGSYA
jgi:hypothetical protein